MDSVFAIHGCVFSSQGVARTGDCDGGRTVLRRAPCVGLVKASTDFSNTVLRVHKNIMAAN